MHGATARCADASGCSHAPLAALRSVVLACGTPTYAYDLACMRRQVARLRAHLPPQIDVFYSLKANASLGLCGFLAQHGLGADVASAGELTIALRAGFPPSRIFLTGPDKSPAVLRQLDALPEVVVSLDSLSELRLLGQRGPRRRVILRLRPDFCSHASCAAGPDSRFGALLEELPAAGRLRDLPGVELVGFHVFAGSQVLSVPGIVEHLRGAVEQSLRAGQMLGVRPQIIDIGGGFGIPYAPGEAELDLAPIGEELQRLVRRAAPARIVIELGRYLVAQAGWYLTRVIAMQSHRGRPAVVVDGGVHQRADVCGIGLRQRALPPVVLRAADFPPGVLHGAAGSDLGAIASAATSDSAPTTAGGSPRSAGGSARSAGGRSPLPADAGACVGAEMAAPDGAGDPHVQPSAASTGSSAGLQPTDVLGCLSLPSDILAEAALLPPLQIGDVLAFPNAGAYGLYASPCQFHAHPPPAEAAWDGDCIDVLRARGSVDYVLQGQCPLSAHALQRASHASTESDG